MLSVMLRSYIQSPNPLAHTRPLDPIMSDGMRTEQKTPVTRAARYKSNLSNSADDLQNIYRENNRQTECQFLDYARGSLVAHMNYCDFATASL